MELEKGAKTHVNSFSCSSNGPRAVVCLERMRQCYFRRIRFLEIRPETRQTRTTTKQVVQMTEKSLAITATAAGSNLARYGIYIYIHV